MYTVLILLLHLSYLLTYITVHSLQRVGVMSLEVTGEKLISGGDDSMIRIWNTNNWTCEQILRAHQVLDRIVSYYCISYHIPQYHIISYYHITSFHIISYYIMSFHILLYHITISFVITSHPFIYIISHYITTLFHRLLYHISPHCFSVPVFHITSLPCIGSGY
jgi:WD40 repeat protein